jgi:hypothetical protein
MPDEGQLIRGIDWRQTLPFTHLFRTFRIAIHPSKLFLGLCLLLTVYLGGRVLDLCWPAKDKAIPDEITLYQTADSVSDFDLARLAADTGERQGLFRTFFSYQANQFNGAVVSVYENQWLQSGDDAGVLGHVYHFVAVGPMWLARNHGVFAVLFAALFIGAWSLFGGAIARLAAVHVARDEKIPLRQALDFAVGKFLSFASAPIMPILMVLGVGILLALGALVGNVPYIGPVIMGAAFFLALIAGFVQVLLIIGTIAGFNLMYPTIAAEGSDSFDAFSRSFSYIYNAPWRTLFYTIIALAYGAATYLFVRFFILLMLKFAHHFVSMGIFVHDAHGGPLLSAMWPSPSVTGRLTYQPDFGSLNWAESIGASLLSFWIYLVIGILGAFAISFYFSINTIIYLLMRRELDATEMDDVYLEQADDEFAGGAEVVVTVETSETAQPAEGEPQAADAGSAADAAPAPSPPAE